MQGLGEPQRRRTRTEIAVMGVILLFFFFVAITLIPQPESDPDTSFCRQPEIIRPNDTRYHNSSLFYESEYAKYSRDVFSGALQIPTVSYDDMDEEPAKEPRFEVFSQFHRYLELKFPLAAKFGQLEYVNTHGMLYTFQGSNKLLKPILLMAHQDVVPVNPETADQWDHEPFSGYFDGEWIHGRGASDTKNTLIGVLEAVEALLKQDWTSQRTLLVAFGFDEEIGGARGAGHLAEVIRERYGPESLEAIIDESLLGLEQTYGAIVASPAVAEKGYIDKKIVLKSPGGHSSQPPEHTGIGIISRLIRSLEANPFAASLTDDHPIVAYYQCLAEHSPRMDKERRRTILNLDYGNHRQILTNLIERRKDQEYFIKTSQAINIINGGVKINALPEEVEVQANYRIAVDSNTAAITEHVERMSYQLAQDFDLSLTSDGETLVKGRYGSLEISSSKPWDPSPVSPYVGDVWNAIGGVTRHIFEKVAPLSPRAVIIAPTIMGANTDTRHFWSLTRSIYRFSPVLSTHMLNYHTVNERIYFAAHLSTVAWFYELILVTTTDTQT